MWLMREIIIKLSGAIVFDPDMLPVECIVPVTSLIARVVCVSVWRDVFCQRSVRTRKSIIVRDISTKQQHISVITCMYQSDQTRERKIYSPKHQDSEAPLFVHLSRHAANGGRSQLLPKIKNIITICRFLCCLNRDTGTTIQVPRKIRKNIKGCYPFLKTELCSGAC